MSEEHTKKGQETEEGTAAAEETKAEESAEESDPEETAMEEAPEESAPEETATEEASGEAASEETATEEAPEESAPEEPVTEEPSEESASEDSVEEEASEEAVSEEAVEDEPAEQQAPEESAEEAVSEEPEAGDGEAEVDEEDQKEAEPAEKRGETIGERAAVGADEEKSARMRWYVVHTYSGRENKVKDTIERMIRNSEMQDQFGKVLVATEEVAEMKKGKKKISQRKLFPSYILIEMEMSDEAWGMIENVPGVTHFVGEGKKPFPIPKKEVDRILGRMVKKEGVVPEVPYTIGEHVKVVDGPFTDFSGIVDEINPERGKLKVLVSIFGRETPVELDFLQVKSL